ncbi:MAG TPA: methyltransferase domain-containing protein [Actinomycetota bacterium]|nr:methyltransferase domain-containing protein [Actinomycetota bacterium]
METSSDVSESVTTSPAGGSPVLVESVPEDPPIELCYFYHYMDLPEVGEVGTGWDLRDTVDDYLGNLDFKGKRVLDVGTASGFLTFAMEDRGAEVVSFDMAEGDQWNVVPFQGEKYRTKLITETTSYMNTAVRNAYWFAHRRVGSKAKAFYGDLYALPEGLGPFDVAIVGMILPHLRDPFLALQNVCALRPKQVVVTQQCPLGDQPHALFMPDPAADPASSEIYFAWWVLTEQCLVNMLAVLGYRVVSIKRSMHRCRARTEDEAPPPPVPRSRFARRKAEPPAPASGMEECSAIVAERIDG